MHYHLFTYSTVYEHGSLAVWDITDAAAANSSDDVLKCMVMRAHISVQEYTSELLPDNNVPQTLQLKTAGFSI